MRKFYGFIIVFGIIIYSIITSARQYSMVFIEPLGLILVIGLVAGLLLSVTKSNDHIKLIKALISDNSTDITTADIVSLSHVLQIGYRIALAAGLLGGFIGMISYLMHSDDPSSLGPAMALSFLSGLYGIILAEFCFGVLIKWLADKHPETGVPAVPKSPLFYGYILGCLGMYLAEFGLLFAFMK